ncbi:HupE/UreJ family protein [Shewanella indica]|uniref:HupE/UreJ family protein n=1 Tax=Shewanella indica TaxID=768528 RepID=A0ABU4Q6R1_9GAMM|nr:MULTISPECIES: HupE/UreJ family protein [Shewanella]MCE9792165.1 HupE/UreJ family protein [Shewanella indica]MDX6015129.1 HupE/UreJ family protein [Shewanella indica]NDO74803.1 hypothetical protein [Shewanella sp. SE1]
MMRSLFAGRSWLFLGVGASLLLSLGVVGRFPEQVMQLNPLMLLASLLVAVGVGVWSAQLGGKALWAVPLSFVLVMLAGTLMAQTSVALIVSKSFVLLSMFVLGMLIAGNICFATHIAAAMVGMLAFAHGYTLGSANLGVADWTLSGSNLFLGYLVGIGATVLILSMVGEVTCKVLAKKQLQYVLGTCLLLAGLMMVVAV